MVEVQNLDELRSVEELSAYRKLVRESITELNSAFDGKEFDEGTREQFADLVEHDKRIERKISELEARHRVIEQMAQDPGKLERTFNDLGREMDSSNRAIRDRERDIYDLRTMRSHSSEDPERFRSEIRDRAMRAIELARFPNEGRRWDESRGNFVAPGRGRIQEHLENLIDSTQERYPGEAARHLVVTGNPLYRSGFWKTAMGMPISQEEYRALSLAGSGGGFAIPFALDPSVIPTSNSVVNPARAIARLVTISGSNTWQGVTSPAVTATRVAEITEATDNSTTLVQPQATVTKSHLAVPFSIEVSEDWPQLESEFGRLIQDAKDDEEGTAFVTGAGTGVNPQGFITGATTTFAFAAGSLVTFHANDIYGLEEALPPRFRARETFVANRSAYNSIRNIDTAGGAALFLYIAQGLQSQAPTPGNTGAVLLGRPAFEASAMKAKVAGTFTNTDKVMIVGDFSYFLIIDRIGITVELVPHIFGAVSRLPIGQRALYAYYRNTSKVLSASAFVVGTAAT